MALSVDARHSSAGQRRTAAAVGVRQGRVHQRGSHVCRPAACIPGLGDYPSARPRPRTYTGPCFVVGSNIDTDQIIPAEFLTLVPTEPKEYVKLGSYALCGLPESEYTTRFVASGETVTKYPVIIARDNFGCGSSREHAPLCMGAAGARVVIAESYARIFFRNCISTGELYPYTVDAPVAQEFETGDEVTVDLDKDAVVNHRTGAVVKLESLGDAGPVVDAGGIFPYARATGMISTMADDEPSSS